MEALVAILNTILQGYYGYFKYVDTGLVVRRTSAYNSARNLEAMGQ